MHNSLFLICPGIHEPQLTQDFLTGLRCSKTSSDWTHNVLIFPTQNYPAYSAGHIVDFLRHHLSVEQTRVVFISFSAGVAGAIGAAWMWQTLGGKVEAFLAIDGWGVPLYGDFPIHRLSHDYFTHWSSRLLGAGEDSFYAEPPIEHLDIWRSPHLCQGYWIHSAADGIPEYRTHITAAEFINQRLNE
ncbi:MAG: hypothetical protein F6J92_01210 [Symploca sp. SIO1A3]|nr:hypothetical protein [Symploca sp. SIO2C1]NER45339.1 hypothetical protein [Symploca sp. SIO1A3]